MGKRAVLDHHRPVQPAFGAEIGDHLRLHLRRVVRVLGGERPAVFVVVGGGWRRHFLDDDFAVGDRAFAPALQPVDDPGGIVDADGGMDAVIRVQNERPGVAPRLVAHPAFLGEIPVGDEGVELRLVVEERQRGGQGQPPCPGFSGGGEAAECDGGCGGDLAEHVLASPMTSSEDAAGRGGAQLQIAQCVFRPFEP